jgi:hypothetical protein
VKRFAALLLVAACRSPGGGAALPDAALLPDALDKAAACASSFGTALTDAFGRIDGTVLAVVPPDLQTCAQPNGTHLVLQITMQGAAYRMVLNVDADVSTRELDAPLAGPAWSDGWHTDAPLDYVTTLGAHGADFTKAADPVALVTDQLELGAQVSVYATSSGGTRADSAHLVHRNLTNADGAIVITPDTAPHYLLFKFDNQTF